MTRNSDLSTTISRGWMTPKHWTVREGKVEIDKSTTSYLHYTRIILKLICIYLNLLLPFRRLLCFIILPPPFPLFLTPPFSLSISAHSFLFSPLPFPSHFISFLSPTLSPSLSLSLTTPSEFLDHVGFESWSQYPDEEFNLADDSKWEVKYLILKSTY